MQRPCTRTIHILEEKTRSTRGHGVVKTVRRRICAEGKQAHDAVAFLGVLLAEPRSAKPARVFEQGRVSAGGRESERQGPPRWHPAKERTSMMTSSPQKRLQLRTDYNNLFRVFNWCAAQETVPGGARLAILEDARLQIPPIFSKRLRQHLSGHPRAPYTYSSPPQPTHPHNYFLSIFVLYPGPNRSRCPCHSGVTRARGAAPRRPWGIRTPDRP